MDGRPHPGSSPMSPADPVYPHLYRPGGAAHHGAAPGPIHPAPPPSMFGAPGPHSMHTSPAAPAPPGPTASYMPASLFPPGTDPRGVDFKEFYPYQPNEVKHRKRTTRQQLKTLEETFHIDTKPNQALRKKLAAELQMTPRSVQVWFQNRRAKEKNLNKKAAEARRMSEGGDDIPPSPDDDDISSRPGSAHARRTSFGDGSAATPSGPSEPTSPADDGSGLTIPPPPSAWAAPVPSFFHDGGSSPESLLALRRGSLPVGAPGAPHPHVYGNLVDPNGRRRSVDASLARLASHPYAHAARAANASALYGARASLAGMGPPQTAPAAPPQQGADAFFARQQRPGLVHRASVPHAMHTHYAPAPRLSLAVDPRYASLAHRGSVDSTASASPDGVHYGGPGPYHVSARTRLLDDSVAPNGGTYMSARTVSSPIPGPLPEPSFAFGAAPHTHHPHQHPHQHQQQELQSQLSAFAFPPRAEDDGASSATSMTFDSSVPLGPAHAGAHGQQHQHQQQLNGAMPAGPYQYGSRFGSIVSVAESDASSVASAFFSDASAACFEPHEVGPNSAGSEQFAVQGRKESCASVVDMFTGFHVDPTTGVYGPHDGGGGVGIALPPDTSPVSDPAGVPHSAGSGSAASSLPSPNSTVSPGEPGSPARGVPASDGPLPSPHDGSAPPPPPPSQAYPAMHGADGNTAYDLYAPHPPAPQQQQQQHDGPAGFELAGYGALESAYGHGHAHGHGHGLMHGAPPYEYGLPAHGGYA